MCTAIHPIRLGTAYSYVVQGEGSIMVDAGSPDHAKDFRRALERLPVRPEEIRLLVITHGHWDHIGSAKDIKEITGAKIAMHRREKDWLEKGLYVLPPGVTTWGRMIVGIMAIYGARVHIPVAQVDIVLQDEELSLSEYGIPGKVVYTPGHSSGSVSVLLDTGDALIGDLAMNGLPLRFGPGLPTLAEDLQRVKGSWHLLLEKSARTVYPGHGKPFSAQVIRRALT